MMYARPSTFSSYVYIYIYTIFMYKCSTFDRLCVWMHSTSAWIGFIAFKKKYPFFTKRPFKLNHTHTNVHTYSRSSNHDGIYRKVCSFLFTIPLYIKTMWWLDEIDRIGPCHRTACNIYFKRSIYYTAWLFQWGSFWGNTLGFSDGSCYFKCIV